MTIPPEDIGVSCPPACHAKLTCITLEGVMSPGCSTEHPIGSVYSIACGSAADCESLGSDFYCALNGCTGQSFCTTPS